jgi:hypothetical protein
MSIGFRADRAFIQGISGELFRQFAVTISVSMVVSAINALTLSPALCGVLMRPGATKGGIMAWVSRRIDAVRDGYAATARQLVRVSVLSLALVGAIGAGTWFADGLPPGGGPGRLLRHGATAAGRLRAPHRPGGRRSRGTAELHAEGRGRDLDRGLLVPGDLRGQQHRLHHRAAQAVRGPRAPVGRR